MYEFTPVGWLKHCVFHPVEGFEDLRWKTRLNENIDAHSSLPLYCNGR